MNSGPDEFNFQSALQGSVWIGGATASGKSAVALEVAQRLQAEIVTVDSMQVYRGMDIGTAKPTRQERRQTPHHLLDEVDVTEAFSVALFVQRAHQTMADLRGRGKRAVLCGGTGLYFQALLEGIGSGPEPDQRLRRSLERTALSRLLEELKGSDPEAYARVDRQNPRRVIRAVEVLRMTGKGVLAHRAPWSRGQESHRPFFVLKRHPEDLRARIEHRVEWMFENGLVQETRKLMNRGLGSNRGARQALGYRQVMEHLEGIRSLDETKELIKRRTWQFARRQRNWFERRLGAESVDVDRDEAPGHTAERMVARLGTALPRRGRATVRSR
jgi:tRNA dimethylallyltransferase